MTSRRDAERLRAAQRRIIALVERDLRAFWSRLDLTRPEAARDALLEFLPVLTTTYGDIAAVAAAEWYEEVRESARVRGRFVPELGDPVPPVVVQERARFGAQHLFTPTPQQTLAFLTGAMSEYALRPGRDTIARSSLADPSSSGWERRTRADGCDFCRMLASRGGVYRRETADFASHGDCNCVAVPSWDMDAPEVDVRAYQASQRMDSLRARAAAGDESAQAQLDAHAKRVRDWVAAYLD